MLTKPCLEDWFSVSEAVILLCDTEAHLWLHRQGYKNADCSQQCQAGGLCLSVSCANSLRMDFVSSWPHEGCSNSSSCLCSCASSLPPKEKAGREVGLIVSTEGRTSRLVGAERGAVSTTAVVQSPWTRTPSIPTDSTESVYERQDQGHLVSGVCCPHTRGVAGTNHSRFLPHTTERSCLPPPTVHPSLSFAAEPP